MQSCDHYIKEGRVSVWKQADYLDPSDFIILHDYSQVDACLAQETHENLAILVSRNVWLRGSRPILTIAWKRLHALCEQNHKKKKKKFMTINH